eukprot:9006-Eustigmatos_ZCMA.PRE.1
MGILLKLRPVLTAVQHMMCPDSHIEGFQASTLSFHLRLIRPIDDGLKCRMVTSVQGVAIDVA